eukprot:s5_g33.t1
MPRFLHTSLEALREELRKLAGDQVADLRLEDGGDFAVAQIFTMVLSVWSAKPWANGRWYDASPYFNLPLAICKRFPKCVLEGSCEHGQGACPATWQSFQGHCYFIIKHPLVFAEAETRCKESLLGCSWVKQWFDLQISDMDTNLTGRWADGLWYDLPASFSLGRAICEFEGTCKAGWDHFRDSCYQLQRWPGSFQEARGHCQEVSAHLVSISSAEEQDFVQRLCGSNMCWLGLEEASKSERWRWIDGSSLTFENWQQGEPNNYGGIDENRAMMNLNFAEAASPTFEG